ncbi:MAG: folate-binding protein [Beijerinckiaceae bacterium]|nr:folate-binding protein [Beijerinckiaceae bacterium]
MKAALLEARGAILVDGPDAAEWLQGLITNDIAKADADKACFAALLSPQGKILFDFLIHRRSSPDGYEFIIDCAASQCPALAKRLAMYRLRSKVGVRDMSATIGIMAFWDIDESPAAAARRDPRHRGLGWRIAGERSTIAHDLPPNASAENYAAMRISCGIPEGGTDFAWGETFPHDVDMDELDGVDFKKGCYVGQEVVSRVQHRGSARKRIRMLEFESGAVAVGTSITAGDMDLGIVTSVAGQTGLGMVRLDRLSEALSDGLVPKAGENLVTITTNTT